MVEARRPSTVVNVLKTLGQIIVFWGTFLVLLPWGVVALERGFGLPRFTLTPWVGGTLLGVASAVGLWCGLLFAVAGRGTPFPLDMATRLVILGPYRVVRNPMALSGIAQGVAVGLLFGSWGTIGTSLAGAVLWHLMVRPWEEADLRRRFGESYAAYERLVPLWLPSLRSYQTLRHP
jgi:protein-S-isoprenylcysteine O-methyltransferase Ste14